jgi:hypothetical protein
MSYRTSSDSPAVESCLLAEWYREELSDNAIDEFFALLGAATEQVSTDAAPVRLLATLFVPSDDVLYGAFVASSSHVVVQACARAGMLPERLVPDVRMRRPDRRNGAGLRDSSPEPDQAWVVRVGGGRTRC